MAEQEIFGGEVLEAQSAGLAALFEKAAHAAAVATAAAQVWPEDGPGILRSVIPAGWTETVTDLEEYRPTPRRKGGAFEFDRTASFIEYVKRHAEDGTAIFARGESFMATMNGHTPDAPGWGDYTATLALVATPSWKAWQAANGSWMNQAEFAEFLEDRIPDIANPAGATLLQIATNLRVHTAINFQSTVKLSNGQVQMTYEEDIDSKAGQKGDLVVPERLNLVVTPYYGTDPQTVDARFQWRIVSGKASFTYKLGEEVTRVREEVLTTTGEAIAQALALPILYGRAA